MTNTWPNLLIGVVLLIVAVLPSASDATEECLICHKGLFPENGSHHIQGVTISGSHCYACHWEATKEGAINPQYHRVAEALPQVDLVKWSGGRRPETYIPGDTAETFHPSAIGGQNERQEVAKITGHCLGCHSNENNRVAPFAGDNNTPRQYAWDGQSVASRYLDKGMTRWGKYSTLNGAGKSRINKAFSAHGNAAANEGGWNSKTGYDSDITITRGGSNAKNVECFDCHNSHSSNIPGITSSYRTSNGTYNGGILKETKAGRGGYAMTYAPSSNKDTASINPYNSGAGMCFDCHETAMPGTTPWGYDGTFGAAQPILGYKDTHRFGQGIKGSSARSAGRQSRTTIVSGHLKAGGFLNYSARGKINGLCTPCHDPHGVSPTIGDNRAYAVPLLRGTWLTSPYREDAPPPSLPKGGSSGRDASGNIAITWDKGTPGAESTGQQPAIHYGIDRNTFGATGRIGESDDLFAGLCLNCHIKEKLTSPGTSQWVHRAVKGWGANREHSFPCSKCHQPHNSGLPRLMQTNCLNAGPSSVREKSDIPWNASKPPKQETRKDAISSASASKKSGRQTVVGCHVKRGGTKRGGNEPAEKKTDEQWNKVTPW